MPAFIDYSGRKIGRVSVYSLNCKKSGGTLWNCKCDCGNEFICWNANFRRGDKFECKGCWNERKRGIDLTGRKYGRWTVIKRGVDSRNKTVWHCKCDCGNEGNIATNALGKLGKSLSCGCLGRKEKSKHINTTLYPPAHGLSKIKFYQIKTSLIHKCYNPKHQSFHLFGGQGVTVCDLWRNGAKDMYEWAQENGWEEGDVFFLKSGEKEFNPETVLIIKGSEFRSLHGLKGGFQITYTGETHSVAKWAEIIGVNKGALRRKLSRNYSVDVVFNSFFRKLSFVRDPSLSKKVVDLYLSGLNQASIARVLRHSPQTIRYHLVKEGVELREDSKQNKRPEIKTEEIIALHSKGVSLNSIAKILRCSFPTVKRRIKKTS